MRGGAFDECVAARFGTRLERDARRVHGVCASDVGASALTAHSVGAKRVVIGIWPLSRDQLPILIARLHAGVHIELQAAQRRHASGEPAKALERVESRRRLMPDQPAAARASGRKTSFRMVRVAEQVRSTWVSAQCANRMLKSVKV